MTKRIFRSIFFVSALTMAVCVILIMAIMQLYFEKQIKTELNAEVHFVCQGIETSGKAYFDDIHTHNRVTWIAADGSVIFDSDADESTLENHSNREEFIEAIKNGSGFSERYSATLAEKTVNYALRVADGTVVRVSSNQYTVWVILAEMVYPLIIIVAAIIILSVILSKTLAKKIVKPINDINPESPDIDKEYSELSPLLHKIKRQNNLISLQMSDLKRRQEEFRAITENMSEGFLIIDANKEVLSYNSSALKLLTTDGTASGNLISQLTKSKPFKTVIEKALGGKHAEEIMENNLKVYQIIANPVNIEGQHGGAVLVILDITEKEQRESMRREFTSNVSHELKTPLTSIYGISEIMKNGIVKPEDIPTFAGNIHEESGRLISLVNDIIKISQLDENSLSAEKQPIDLYASAKTVVSRLKSVAAKRNIALSVSGTSAQIDGIPAIIEEMIYNLCDNAIKYNKDDGQVNITVTVKKGHPQISVKDTGIGIAKEHIDRVFERFYCVDKSHSKSIGGTGLGLSIVKHGANYHNAKIKIESELGKGTEITVIF